MTASPQRQILRIASRNSPLALWQANYVKSALESVHVGLDVMIIGFTTQGDRILDTALSKVGGKGLFVKELEVALLEDEADIAVHSMKDVPMELPEGLILPVYCPREDPRDALVSQQYGDLDSLPPGARVGTSSLRRQCQLRAQYPNLDIRDLRGNVNTRLSKLDNGDYEAIILATAGLLRLNMTSRIQQKIPVETSLPAAGQGALGIECRAEDDQTISLIERLHDPQTALAVQAERAVNRRLDGGCQVPVACYGEITDKKIFLRALVGSVDGRIILSDALRGEAGLGEELGVRLAERLLDKGADKVLAEFFEQHNYNY